ncbi:hypothetical protein DFH06DRAFT_1198093 [Mycena polygramma]|nr:hypothetical protein DFH06DRAFT_1198093 [Mycena polygramma]
MAYAMSELAIPPMQTALTNPVKWNTDWENLLAKQGQHISPAEVVQWEAMGFAMNPDMMKVGLLTYQSLLGSLISLQMSITSDATRYFARDDLKNKWMDASPAVRGKHVLIGLSGACSIAKNLHDARMHCRELRLARLQGDGRVVLDLFKAIMVPNTHAEQMKLLGKPLHVPDAAWDAYADLQQRSSPTDSAKLALGNILTLRTKLICHFLHFTIRSFLGEELPKISVDKQKKIKTVPEPFPAQSKGAKAAAKDAKDALKARQNARIEHCSYVGCGKINDGTEKFPRCKKCWEVNQIEVVYCSAVCQKADWKVNHKPIRGKALSFDSASKPRVQTSGLGSSYAEPVIGPPSGSYKRSPLLVELIKKLNEPPQYDYIIGDYLANMDLYNPEVKLAFRKCREKAMATGDRQSIAVMAHFLCWTSMDDNFQRGVTPNVIVDQLKEYLFDELHLAVTEMQQRQNMDPFRRPVLLSTMSPQVWFTFCGGTNVQKRVILG